MVPVAEHVHESVVDHALFDGEDYELLFTLSSEEIVAFLKAWNAKFEADVYKIGEITDIPNELLLQKKDGQTCKIVGEGYSHF